MKKLLLTTQILFSVIFLAGFVASFFVVESILENSKSVITDKVVASVSGKVAFAEEALNSKIASKVLAEYQIETIREEIGEFTSDPYQYVEAVVMDSRKTEVIPPELISKNLLKNKLITKVYSWKVSLKGYFEKTFNSLVWDIRIFLMSNVIALLIAAFVCFKGKGLGKEALAVSVILTAVVALSALTYLNQNWLYTILLNNYGGYGYPVGILCTSGWLIYEYCSSVREST